MEAKPVDLAAAIGAFTDSVPVGMVDLEYQAIWQSIEAERKRGTDDPSISGKSSRSSPSL